MANGDVAQELAEKVREVICEEWQGAGGSLQSAVVYQRLLEEGVEVSDYQMSAILNAFKAGHPDTAYPGDSFLGCGLVSSLLTSGRGIISGAPDPLVSCYRC